MTSLDSQVLVSWIFAPGGRLNQGAYKQVYTSNPKSDIFEKVYTSDPKNDFLEKVYTSDPKNDIFEKVCTSDQKNIFSKKFTLLTNFWYFVMFTQELTFFMNKGKQTFAILIPKLIFSMNKGKHFSVISFIIFIPEGFHIGAVMEPFPVYAFVKI